MQANLDGQSLESLLMFVKLVIVFVAIGIGKDIFYAWIWIDRRLHRNSNSDPYLPLTLKDAGSLFSIMPNNETLALAMGETRSIIASSFQELRLELVRNREVTEKSREDLLKILTTENLRYELELKKLQMSTIGETITLLREKERG